MNIHENFDLKTFNTFHVSARSRYFADVTSLEQLQEVLSWSREHDVPFMLIGQGSNILFKQDYPGLIIELNIKGKEIFDTDAAHADIRAMCGENWHDLVRYSLGLDLFGLENLSLIPGNVGAAPVQNIGAYGAEVKDTLLELEALEIATGNYQIFTNADCKFSYRNSVFKQELRDKYIICSVTFRLSKEAKINLEYPSLKSAFGNVDPATITPLMVSDMVCSIRKSKLPDPSILGNAGSFFWNPRISPQQFAFLKEEFPAIAAYPEDDHVKIAAAWLIEQAGWKGYREGDVGVHQDHALVLVNYGSASGAELVALSEKIQASVLAKFRIQLHPEVRIV
ncbi:MAG: UDP-N-acetylmuramate dehydrogenase [Pseudomonadota bacterium]